jgi:parallel beta-helix repeat protein
VNNQLNDAPWAYAGAGGTGIFLWQAPGCQIDHNECDNNPQFGIFLANSPNCTADHNQADNNGDTGIAIGGSPNCVVVENEADNNGVLGISVGGSCGSSFAHNVAEGNGQYDLFAPNWDSLPTCNTYQENHANTAVPSLALWDVK